MSKFKFWTISEDNALRTCLSKFKNDASAAKWAAEKFERTVGSVYQRIILIKSGKQISYKERKIKTVKPSKKDNGFNIPEGFTFDIKPSKAVMFKDHIRLYF